MAKNWTEDQKKALFSRGESLVVSAAAGSGKTSVLTQRIISLLSDPNGIDAARLAVVTFTKAAAGELQNRLYLGLSEEVAKHPENRLLSRQLFRLSRAQISTIHSFCFSLIRRYRKTLDLGAKLRIADPREAEILLLKSVEDALEEKLSDAGTEKSGMEKLLQLFGTGRSDQGLIEAVIRLYQTASSFPGGLSYLEEKLSSLQKEEELLTRGEMTLDQTKAGILIVSETKRRLCSAKTTLSALLSSLSSSQTVEEKYTPFLEERIAVLERVMERLDGGDLFGAVRLLEEGFSAPLPRIVKCPPEEADLKKSVSQIHNEKVKKPLLAFCLSTLSQPRSRVVEDLGETVRLSSELLGIARRAEALFSLAKRERGILDYQDLEQFALKLVAKRENGTFVPTETANQIAQEFDAVFVDEYQDTNGIQDLLFRFVSRGNNLFIVGDPKQSIYRFRGAEPSIFSSYKNELPFLGEGGEGMKKILLSDNFRCDEPIISFVNTLFSVMMDAASPTSLYQKEDRLRYAKGGSPKKAFPVELVLVEKEETGEASSDPESLLEEEENREAAYISGRIDAILNGQLRKEDGSLYRPEDIAVICRTGNQIELVRRALSLRQIPTAKGTLSDRKENPEYLFLTSYFQALDNPGQDIPLLSTLSSPVFRFSADALYRIRKAHKNVPFYTALCLYAEREGTDETALLCRDFLKVFHRERERSKEFSLQGFVFHTYRHFSLAQLYACTGEASLFPFFREAAIDAENAEFSSLSDFCRYLEKTEEEESENTDGVRLMTIHKSKGLEFPIVFVSFLAQTFNTKSEKATMLLSPNLGIGLSVPHLSGRAKVNTFFKKAMEIELHREAVEEEKRILYVAMTRACEKLIVSFAPRSLSSLSRDLLLFARDLPAPLTRHLPNEASSPLHLILSSLRTLPALKTVLDGKEREEIPGLVITREKPLPFRLFTPKDLPQTHKPEPEWDSLLPRLEFTYPDRPLESLPEKLSVSELLKRGREEEAGLFPRTLLDFEKGILTSDAAKIGTATHQVMQYIDFSRGAEDPEKEMQRLVKQGFLTPEDMALVDPKTVAAFFASPLYKRIAESKKVMHEKRFHVLLPAEPLLGTPGEVLVQGVVDVWFENPDGTITLLDFKTDRVKDPEGEGILIERHQKQLSLYQRAVEKMTGKTVSHLCLYSFELDREIPIPTDDALI